MKTALVKSSDAMTSRLFFRLLPVQVGIVAMGSVNCIVDGIVAARFVDATTVGVIGLYYTMLRVLEAVGAVLLVGVSVLSARRLGAGRLDETKGLCSLGFTLALIMGALISGVSLAAPRLIADILGANAEMMAPLASYVSGYAIGIVPQLLVQQLVASLQMEHRDGRCQAGMLTMIAVNVVLDIVFVALLGWGVWGLALATSLANWAYFLVLASTFLDRNLQLKPNPRLADWGKTGEVLKTGFPNALLVICLAARSLVVNRLLLAYGGGDGLNALSAFNMVIGFIIAVALGAGAVVRMLSSVYLGEENREGIFALMKTVFTRAMALGALAAAVVALLSPLLAGVFFPDAASRVHKLTRDLIAIYGACIPLTLACVAISSYAQAAGHRLFVNLLSLTDGFFSMAVPAMLLAPLMGAAGVWLAYPIGLVITLAVSVLYPVARLRRWPGNGDEWLLLPERFGEGARLVLTLRGAEDVANTAERAQAFCLEQAVSPRIAAHVGLCLEEMAGNIVRHGFHTDHRAHVVELRVALGPGEVTLRIKDDCAPFNPKEWHDIAMPADPTANIGIRLVYALAREVEYQNMLGLNVLTIRLAAE